MGVVTRTETRLSQRISIDRQWSDRSALQLCGHQARTRREEFCEARESCVRYRDRLVEMGPCCVSADTIRIISRSAGSGNTRY